MDDDAIVTERLRLRPWRTADIEPFMAATNTDPVSRWLGGVQDRAHFDDLCARMIVCQAEQGHSFWIAELRDSGAIIGFCGARIAGHPGTPVCGEMELGWRLGSEWWGQGYAREAAEASADWVWRNRPERERLIAYTVPGNAASWGLMRRLGMTYRREMDFDHPSFPPGHELCRHIVYTLERP